MHSVPQGQQKMKVLSIVVKGKARGCPEGLVAYCSDCRERDSEQWEPPEGRNNAGPFRANVWKRSAGDSWVTVNCLGGKN